MAASQLVPASPEGQGRRVARPAPLRLTRRGRVVARAMIIIGFVLAVWVAVLGVGRTANAGTRPGPGKVTSHVVLPGETLLQIAATVDGRVDARDTAVRIARLNGLRGWGLQVGQRLVLPVEG